MKKDWTYKKLGEVATIYDSQRKPVTKKDRKSGPYPYYGATGVQDYVDKYIFDGRYVLVGEDGARWSSNEKSAYIIEGKSWVNNHAHVLSFDNSIIDCFIVYYLNYSNLDPYITGAIIKKLTQKDLLSISIPIPPLSIQRSIVAELDLLHSVISKKKEQLRELDNFAQSLFYQMFGDPITNPMGWEIKKLGEVGIVKIGPFGSLLHKDDYITGGIPIVNPVHMKDGYIKPDLDFTVTQEKIDDLSSYVLRTNDFIFARRGDIGRCAIVREQDNGFICGTGSLFVRFKDKVDPIYTFYVSQSPSFINVLKEQAKGATMLNINCGIVENLHIPIPPLSLQQSFAAKVSAIEAQKQAITQSIQHTEALLAQRMGQYFA